MVAHLHHKTTLQQVLTGDREVPITSNCMNDARLQLKPGQTCSRGAGVLQQPSLDELQALVA